MECSNVTVMTSASDLLRIQIRWRKIAAGVWEARVDGRRCVLTMNDFPEEPLYTVSFEEESIDIDDAPAGWVIE